ncbi:aminopeptidase [Paucibacter sp. R3-3]|uniref:Aminopeptidase n=1 Tax=Roseateles agri TaxID=3098619 RepID=A0ABU5DNH2_9BURK|nr:aminopeptidase [Paucibacter sp. R3-3]MDY0747862.1 aminopeptidase [Paucibacter sp. R3-3]
MIGRRLAILLVAGLAAVLVAGCGQVGYLAQSLNGHMRMMSAAEPVSTLLARPDLDPKLRERLQLSQRLRDYAITELHLPDNNSYRRYADLHRGAAVWNVIAAPELSLKAKTWCYPIMGCVAYRGYFDQAAAEAYARGLREDDEHLEVMVGPVPAYSTLGWSTWLGGDPLLNTFIGYPEGELARMMFHELAHQVAYADDDTTFNESFATAVERIGAARWLKARGSEAARETYERGNQRRLQFRALTDAYRVKLAAVYDSAQDDEAKRAAKAHTMQALREDYAKLKAEEWGGYSGYDDWFARANNASFALLSAYGELVPAFEALFEREGEDWPRFYAEVKRLAKLPKAERRSQLESH